MVIAIIISIILFILAMALLYLLNKKTGENARLAKQEERAWTLKVALEKTFKLPTVEAKELERIEPEISRIMNSPDSNEEAEEKMRLAIMELYAKKYERGGKKVGENPS
jgi:flagellar basal body-associated protein FliL